MATFTDHFMHYMNYTQEDTAVYPKITESKALDHFLYTLKPLQFTNSK